MREADDVIVLHNGRMLGKGSFTELKENGILNETVDSMYEKAKESDDIVVKDNEDKMAFLAWVVQMHPMKRRLSAYQKKIELSGLYPQAFTGTTLEAGYLCWLLSQ